MDCFILRDAFEEIFKHEQEKLTEINQKDVIVDDNVLSDFIYDIFYHTDVFGHDNVRSLVNSFYYDDEYDHAMHFVSSAIGRISNFRYSSKQITLDCVLHWLANIRDLDLVIKCSEYEELVKKTNKWIDKTVKTFVKEYLRESKVVEKKKDEKSNEKKPKKQIDICAFILIPLILAFISIIMMFAIPNVIKDFKRVANEENRRHAEAVQAEFDECLKVD